MDGAEATTMASPPSLLSGVAAATSIRDRDDLDHAIAALLLQFLRAHSVSILRLGSDGDTTDLARQVAVSSVSDKPCSPVSADSIACQKCISENHVVQCEGPNDRLLTLIPIRGEREVAGVLIVDAADGLPPRDAELVHGILQIAKNHLALLDYGERDTLTGLLNRKTFEARFEKQRQQIAAEKQNGAEGESSWLALIDIDRFKSINDTYGHLFGDEVLLLISQDMKRCFRGADHLFRFGGEEFLVILDQASDAGARIALERLRATIEAHPFPQVTRVTISLGYTRIAKGDMPSNSVERADAALYYAKGHGRNNLQNFEALVAAGELAVKRATDNVELF